MNGNGQCRFITGSGKTGYAVSREGALLLVNPEGLLIHYRDLGRFFDGISGAAQGLRRRKSAGSFMGRVWQHGGKAKRGKLRRPGRKGAAAGRKPAADTEMPHKEDGFPYAAFISLNFAYLFLYKAHLALPAKLPGP